MGGLAAGGAAALQGSVSSAEEIAQNWIDAHVHVWTPDFERYPISKNFSKKSVNPPSYSPDDLAESQKGTGVKRTVLIQMSFYEFDNSYMLDVINAEPKRFSGVAIVDETQDNVAQKMKGLAERGVRGFRLYAFPDRVKTWDTSEGIQTMWRTGAAENLAMCCLTDPASLGMIHKICSQHPDTTVVIDHFARIGMKGEIDPSQLDQLLALSQFPNTYVKTSAFYALGKKAPPHTELGPMIHKLRDEFGADRLIWGSDCPYQVQGENNYEASVDLITKKLPFLKESEIQSLMQGTAQKLFFS